MNDLVVGMGEALWDVLPEGKKIGGARQFRISRFSIRTSELCGQCSGRR